MDEYERAKLKFINDTNEALNRHSDMFTIIAHNVKLILQILQSLEKRIALLEARFK